MDEQTKVPTARNTEAEIDAFAKDEKIELGDASTKADKVAVIEKALADRDAADDASSDEADQGGDDQGSDQAPEVVTGQRDDVETVADPSPSVPSDADPETGEVADGGDEQSARSTAGGEQRATASSGNAFDGAVTAGSSNLVVDEAEGVHDATATSDADHDRSDTDPASVEGIGQHDAYGPVYPGASNAEFSDDLAAEKGATARGAASTPAAGPLDAPESGYSNTVGEESYGRSAYQADAGPRPDEEEAEDDSEIVGRDGSGLDSGDLFTTPEGAQTFCFAKQRIYEQYTYPNTHEKARRLLYPEGARVGIAEAAAVQARA